MSLFLHWKHCYTLIYLSYAYHMQNSISPSMAPHLSRCDHLLLHSIILVHIPQKCTDKIIAETVTVLHLINIVEMSNVVLKPFLNV